MNLLYFALLLAPLAVGTFARAQGPDKPSPDKPVIEKPKLPELGLDDSGRKEMIELFHKVEKRLGEIDKLLYDASAGDKKVEALKESGIGDLLKTSTDKSQQVLKDIDRILEIASKSGGTCQSAMAGSSGQQSQGGSHGSPLDKQGDQQSARENTPEKPGGKEPQPGGDKKPEPSSAQNGQPKSPNESNAEPHEHRGAPPPGLETQKQNPAQQNERWGDLPQHVRDLFRTEGGGDMPLQYRDWIDAYYRRLNQRP